jgi:hypothetical protein
MSVMQVQDRAHEFRIVIHGGLTGDSVRKVADTWASALGESQRRMVVDITDVSDCDGAGRELLRDMHVHGTHLAAKTPESLALLAEATRRRTADAVAGR